MMNMNKMVARAAIRCMASVNKMKNAAQDFLSSEKGMTIVEIVLLIAVAVVLVGALSAYMMGALDSVFDILNGFIGGANSASITQGPV